MTIYEQYMNNLIEKASIDWNNYLTRDELDVLFHKDDKVESAEEVIYNTEGNFYNKYYQDFKKEGWTKRELVKNLADFCYQGHFNGKQVLREQYVLKGIKDGESFDISYSDKKEKLEKFRDEVIKDKTIETSIIKEDNNAFELWKRQLSNKSRDELKLYYQKLIDKLDRYNKVDFKQDDYLDLTRKINYIENTYKFKNKIGLELK